MTIPEARALTHEFLFRPSKFLNVNHLVLFFDRTFNDEECVLHYIGFKGMSTQFKAGQVYEAVYEARGLPEDHKVKDSEAAHMQFGT